MRLILDGIDAEIKVDFLDGDTLIIDKSLEVVTSEFESLETINDILDDLLLMILQNCLSIQQEKNYLRFLQLMKLMKIQF